MMGMMGFGYLAMAFSAVVVVAIVALAVWAAVRLLGGGDRRQTHDTDEAEEILDRRYAQGEIDDEEYQQRRDALAPRR
jgi:putative membrane protein